MLLRLKVKLFGGCLHDWSKWKWETVRVNGYAYNWDEKRLVKTCTKCGDIKTKVIHS